MADIDAVIRKCVDDIWAEYDTDNSGSIEKDEMAVFIKKVAGLWSHERKSTLTKMDNIKGI